MVEVESDFTAHSCRLQFPEGTSKYLEDYKQALKPN